MNKNIRIGDRVRFLNDVGGGIVRRIVGQVVYVEDTDGFEMPTTVAECVVVADGDSYMPAYKPPRSLSGHDATHTPTQHSMSDATRRLAKDITPPPPTETSRMDEVFRPKRISSAPTARHDKLNVALAFLPMDEKRIGAEPFEAYLVNDSNYTILFTYTSREGEDCTLRAAGRLDPNSKIFIEEIAPSGINEIAHLQIQLITYKESTRFVPKPAFSIDLKIDAVRFFKLHSFSPNDFFDEGAIIYHLIQDDKAIRPLEISADEVAVAMITKKQQQDKLATSHTRIAPKVKDQIVEIDLHATELLDSTAGMSAIDILNYQLETFRRILADHAKEKGKRIVFIHGKGEGVLRKAIETELKRKYPKYEAHDASFREYGFGATMVIIH